MKSFRYFLFLSLLVFPYGLWAQPREIILSGQVLEEKGAPLGYANAVLMAPENTDRVYGVVSDASGVFRLTVPPGRYLLEVSYLGYKKYNIELELTQNTALEPMGLQRIVQQMDAVQITAPKIT